MSSLGNLGECLMDSDTETIVRARRLRGKALILSVAAEAVMIGAMLVWPLVTPGVLPRRFVFTPAPPYDGGWAHVMNVHHGSSEQPRSTVQRATLHTNRATSHHSPARAGFSWRG